MDYNKHYIRLDENNNIIKGFSDAFEEPLETDICINEEGQRHFELMGVVNPSLIDENGCHKYKYVDSKIIEWLESEKEEWRIANLPQPIDPNLTIEERITQLELLALESEGII